MTKFGIDILLQADCHWKTRRIGLVTNHAATTCDGTPSRQALMKRQFNLQKLFSPEHGLAVTGGDGHYMENSTDGLTSLPVTSLYGEKLAPADDDLADIDIVLFDIPDIGSRFYTYLWTMTYMLEACARCHKKFIILDRPDPVSGNPDLMEGPLLNISQASFIGRWPIPVRHSCTLGELARYFNATRQIGCDLEVVRCTGWERGDFQPDWGMRFVPTSPAIRDFQAMLLYPGLCLLEATNISEGRGTGLSFRTAGAPWIQAGTVAGILNDMGLDEVAVTPVTFIPDIGKYAGEKCNGVGLEVREPAFFQSVSFGMILISLIKQLYPDDFEWRPYPTMVNPTGAMHLDKLLGMAGCEQLFELPLPQFIAQTTKLTQCREWKKEIEKYYLY